MATVRTVSTLTASDFRGTPRYQIVRRLGSGGFGVVYEAHDELAQTRVALKTLHRLTADGLFTLKQEFRSLADVFHPNLVALYELTEHEGYWFFTMEYLDGVDFYSYLRPDREVLESGESSSSPDMPTAEMLISSELQRTDAAHSWVVAPPSKVTKQFRPLLSERLRPALAQLVEGVNALHRFGMLHRDLKPSNVLVSRDSRLTLLDFGLVREHNDSAQRSWIKRSGVEADDEFIAGTPQYMSPEQGNAEPTTPASDWYAVGTMLYEALAGRRPFEGTVAEIITDRQYNDPPHVSQFASDIPEDLETLVMDLIQRDPSRRPTGAAIAARVGAQSALSLSSLRPSAQGFVGREEILQSLDAAVAEVRAGQPVVCELYGPSGIGKSALASHFLERCRQTRNALVFTGRCEERKAVPFKTVDGVIDALSAYLRQLSREELLRVLPERMDVLARVFPVLPTGKNSTAKKLSIEHDVRLGTEGVTEDRRIAVSALTELLRNIASDRLVLLYLDDLQWGDEDSADLLRNVLSDERAPGLLLLGTIRGDDGVHAEHHSPFARRSAGRPIVRRSFKLGPLETVQMTHLATIMFERYRAMDPAHVRALVQECDGNPFFLGELVHHFREQKGSSSLMGSHAPSLTDVVLQRVSALPEKAQRMLELMAVVGQPVAQSLLMEASAIGSEAYGALRLLRAGNFVRFIDGKTEDHVDLYHDRIRETVVGALPPETLLACHQRMVRAVLTRPNAHPALLATHLDGAGMHADAAIAAEKAAERAESAFAFDAAADWLKKAMQWNPSPALAKQLMPRLAFAYAAVGQNTKAADGYVRAAQLDPSYSLEYRNRAMFYCLSAGERNEGLELLRSVAGDVGISVPSGSAAAILGIVRDQLWIRIRGATIKEREPNSISPRDLQRIDVTESAGVALAFSDSVSATYFLIHSVRLALAVGEPVRAARGLVRYLSTQVVADALKNEDRAKAMLAQANAVAERYPDPFLKGLLLEGRGVIEMCLNQWADATRSLEQAVEAFRSVPGSFTEMDNSESFLFESRWMRGDIRAAISQAERLGRQCEQRGFLGGELRYQARHHVFVCLARDLADEAEASINLAMQRAPTDRFLHVHFHEVQTRALIAFYRGRPEEALQWFRSRWSEVRRTGMMFYEVFRFPMLYVFASALVGAARTCTNPKEKRALLKEAKTHGQALIRERLSLGRAYGEVIMGCVTWLEGDPKQALALLTASVASFTSLQAMAFCAAARRLLGACKLANQDLSGAALIAEADAQLRAESVQNPARFATTLVPDLFTT